MKRDYIEQNYVRRQLILKEGVTYAVRGRETFTLVFISKLLKCPGVIQWDVALPEALPAQKKQKTS